LQKQQQAIRRRNRPSRRQTDDGLYHIEEDVLGSGTVLSSPKMSKLDDLPSYEDAVLASGHRQLAEAKINQATPSNVNDNDVEVN
jgi:hypothetical protein